MWRVGGPTKVDLAGAAGAGKIGADVKRVP